MRETSTRNFGDSQEDARFWVFVVVVLVLVWFLVWLLFLVYWLVAFANSQHHILEKGRP